MKKLFVLFAFVSLLSGCSVTTNGILNNPGPGMQSQQQVQFSSATPEDQFTKTGMIRMTFDGPNASQQYLMGGNSQQILSEDARTQLLTGPVQKCMSQTGKAANKCFEDFLFDVGKNIGPEAAFAHLKILYDVSADVRAYCHPLAHEIGHSAVYKYPKVAEAYKHGDDFCWSGYYHGVMEEIMEGFEDGDLAGHIDGICADIPGKENYSFDYYNCIHGMGHGLMDVMANQLQEALKMCDNLTGNWEQQSCYSGVFMQNVINDNQELTKADLKPEDTVYPCNVVDQKYKDQCYLMQTSYMLKINHYDFAATFEICKNVDEGFSVTCYRSLGRDASGSTVSDLQKTHDICMLGKDFEQKSECLVGAVKDFISYYHSDVKAKQLCESFDDQKINDYCLQTAVEYYKTF